MTQHTPRRKPAMPALALTLLVMTGCPMSFDVPPLRVGPADIALAGVGDSEQLFVSSPDVCSMCPAFTDLTNASSGTTYEVLNPDVATVGPDGFVEAVGLGQTSIVVSNGGESVTVVVTVREVVNSLRTEITYVRSGGFGGFFDEVTVAPDGVLMAAGSTFGDVTRMISEEETSELLRLVTGWDDIAEVTRDDNECCDQFEHGITYDGRTLRYSDATSNVPPELRAIANFMRDLAD